jgi:hypothetical protein
MAGPTSAAQDSPGPAEATRNPGRANAPATQTHFRDFIGKKAEALTDTSQQLDVAFTIVAKG